MAEQQTFTINIKVKDDGTTATLHNITTGAKVSGVAVEDLKKKYQGFAETVKSNSGSLQMSAQEFNQFAASASGASKASGGAASSVMELGRVISDAPYGIRGVANNLSQLASNMLFTSQQIDKTTGKAIGFTGVLGQMGKAFLGPLGILVGIQAVLALLETFSSSMKKAENAVVGFTSAGVTTAVVRLNYLKQVLEDTSQSIETKQEMVKRANGEFKDLNVTIEKNGLLTTAGANALQNFTNELINSAKAAAVMEKITELTKQMVELEVLGGEGELGFLGGLEKWALAIEGMSLEESGKIAAKNVIKGLQDEIDKFTDYLGKNNLNPYVFNPGDGTTTNAKNAEKVVKTFFLDLEREINSAATRFFAANTRNVWELLDLEQGAERDALTKKWTDYQNKLDLQEEYLQQKLDKGLISETFFNEQMAELAENAKQGERDFETAMFNLEMAQEAERNRKKEDARRDHLAALRQVEMEGALLMQELTGLNFEYEDDMLNQRLLDIQSNYEKAQADLFVKKMEAVEKGQDLDVIDQEAANLKMQRDLDVAATEQELAENRVETMGYIGNAFAAVSDLIGKETAAGKALAIAAATIDTYVAGVQTMKDPTIPNGPAKVAAMIAVIASGLATVKKIVSTKVPGGRDSSGGGGASTTFNPNFNIVGQSAQNQLAETVAGQAAEPARAYIVYDDIASANEIEANSVHSASFG